MVFTNEDKIRFDFDNRPPFDSRSTAVRPRYYRSTTYVMTVGLPVDGCCVRMC